MQRKTNRDDYFVIYVTTPTGFECKVPARGYNLKSWLAFEDNLKNTYYYEHTTKEVYEHLVFGDPNGIIDMEDEDEPRASKGKALKETTTKRKPRAKANEDSKAVRSTSKRTASSSKEARTELREPKVRTMRKSTKTVARTNDSGKASLPRSRSSKSKTQ